MLRTLSILTLAALLGGCAQFNSHSVGNGKPFEPYGDGIAAIAGESVSLPGLQMAYAKDTVSGQTGPGTAFFYGPMLSLFAADDNTTYFSVENPKFLGKFNAEDFRLETLQAGSHAWHDELITWGLWQETGYIYFQSRTGRERSSIGEPFFYVLGKPTSALPMTGKAVYTAIGGAASWFMDRYEVRSQLGRSQLAVDWGGLTRSESRLN